MCADDFERLSDVGLRSGQDPVPERTPLLGAIENNPLHSSLFKDIETETNNESKGN